MIEALAGIGRFIPILFEVILIFNLMIVVHEYGHFLAARWRGLKIETTLFLPLSDLLNNVLRDTPQKANS